MTVPKGNLDKKIGFCSAMSRNFFYFRQISSSSFGFLKASTEIEQTFLQLRNLCTTP